MFPFPTQVGGPADQLFTIPISRWRDFKLSLEYFIRKFGVHDLRRISLHYMHMPQALGDRLTYACIKAGVDGMPKKGCDANTKKEGNPIFRILGRDEGQVKWNKWWTYLPPGAHPS